MNKPLSDRPNIKVLQYMYGAIPYFSWSEKINRHYCRKHGYRYVLSRESPRGDRHITWHKVSVIIKELHDCDYLLFLDADAVFYSQELRVESELVPLLESRDVLMAQDILSDSARPTPGLPNSGVILIRVGECARRIFKYWDMASEIDEESRWTWPPEQLALWRVVLPRWGDRIKVHSEYYLFQGIYGQFIRHWMNVTNPEREKLMKHFCQRRNIE